jgi:hypothetical protein
MIRWDEEFRRRLRTEIINFVYGGGGNIADETDQLGMIQACFLGPSDPRRKRCFMIRSRSKCHFPSRKNHGFYVVVDEYRLDRVLRLLFFFLR